LQNLIYFNQNQHEMPEIFSVANFECRVCYCCIAEQYFFLTHAKGVFKIVGYVDVRCKQQAVVEVLVTETDSVTNIDKQ